MRTLGAWKPLLFSALAGALAIPSTAGTLQCPGNAPSCMDDIQSIGMLVLDVAAPFRGGFAGNSNYDPITHIFVSPVLYDPHTMISRTAPFSEGSAQDSTGEPATPPPGYPEGGNLDEIHTSVADMNLTDFFGSGFRVAAGISAPGAPASLGEVTGACASIALSSSCDDFPANSFFDIFVDVTVPGGTHLHNDAPLIVQNTGLLSLPPTVLYTHSPASNSVNLIITDPINCPANTTNPACILGQMLVVGHGANFGPNSSSPAGTQNHNGVSDFLIQFQSFADTQLDPQQQTFFDKIVNDDLHNPDILTLSPEPSTIGMFFGGAALLAFVRRRTRR